MKFDQLVLLLPCQSLEDLSLEQSAADAEQLLSGWSALWHPVLLSGAEGLPSWLPAEEPPSEPAGHLVIVPDCAAELIPEDWPARAAAAGACVLRGLGRREEIIAAALKHLDVAAADVDRELVDDFLALGLCHFLVELLTRQLHYMSNLDEEALSSESLAGAGEAVGGDAEAARRQIQAAFDVLNESREYFYPVEAHLLDLTLVAATTLGQSLRDELAGQFPTNLLISGEVLEQMAQREPATLGALTAALREKRAAIIGGEFVELPLPLLPPEAIRDQIERGLAAYKKYLGVRPMVFGRRRFGLTPVLPQILTKLGFSGAIHCTLDDGRFPIGSQSHIQWEGVDGTSLESLGRPPIDVGRTDTFLALSEKLGDCMDLDHVATVVLAHWPGHSSRWYEDLKRIAKYAPVIGTFSNVNDYFEETALSGEPAQYRADQYRSPYLGQDVAAGRCDPISRWARYYRRRAMAEAAETFGTLTALVTSRAATDTSSDLAADLLAEVERSVGADGDGSGDLDARLQTMLDHAAEGFCGAITGSGGQGETGYLVANPWSFPRRMCLELPQLAASPAVGAAVRAVDEKSAVVDVPAMGSAWVGPGMAAEKPPEAAARRPKRRKKKSDEALPLAQRREEDVVLRNDFFEVVVDPHTGALQSVSDYYSRGPRLAQQIALRMPAGRGVEPGDDANYSIMAADQLAVTSAGPILGEVVCRGRLVDREARRLAGFTQTTRVRRGSRIIELSIELDVDRQPGGDPWNSYYAARLAWGDETANLYRSANMANVPTDGVQLEAPLLVDIRAGKVRTTLLCGGMAYHRRFGLRKLDTLLVVRGETARSFRLGIGIDVPHPMAAALDFLAPATTEPGVRCPGSASGWLFHLDARNVVATRWEPLWCDGRTDGFRVRLLETDGRKVEARLRSFRPVRSARKAPAGTTAACALPVDGDRITVPLGPHEWAEVEGRFQQ